MERPCLTEAAGTGRLIGGKGDGSPLLPMADTDSL